MRKALHEPFFYVYIQTEINKSLDGKKRLEFETLFGSTHEITLSFLRSGSNVNIQNLISPELRFPLRNYRNL